MSYLTAAVGALKCSSCGHSETVVRTSQSKNGTGDVLGALAAIAIVALGALVVGSIVGSLSDNNSGEKELPKYDEENWKRHYR